MKEKEFLDIMSWIVGFVDGKGCFCVSFNKRTKLNVKVETRCSFLISQNAKSLESLKLILSYFKCGGLRYSKKYNTYKYEVRNIKDLNKIIIPFFEKYSLKTKKNKDFFIFSVICQKVFRKLHLNMVELKTIIDLAYQMNNSGKRTYSREKLLSFINKLKV